jgi:mono/diheme cytochrome c family protein
MRVRYAFLFTAALVVASCSLAQDNSNVDRLHLPPRYVQSGEQMYKQFCADCHGDDAKGHGPAASSLKVKPPNLTTLTQRHHGKFPYEYVSSVDLGLCPSGASTG